MDSKLRWFMKNPAIYLGTILLLTFGIKLSLGYMREREFYILDLMCSTIGLITVVVSITKKISNKTSKTR
ncbi:hypothetical protein SAMN04487777_11320 [Priestia aryabhattai B8W22]|uniref:hypothetical protein n=1 Tax=Priestia aryabhattai TaxID=412384 RepID=UPI00088FCA1F|nr:hypothetical protein SAMN04487777_11320 [Priestia aryabhattai B8W22]